VVTCFPNHPAGDIYPGYRRGVYLREAMDGIDVRRLWTFITPNKGVVKRTIGHISFATSAILADPWLGGDTDVVIGSSPTLFSAVAAARAAAHRGVPFVMEVRDLWPASITELGVIRSRAMLAPLEWLEMALYREASGIVTVTEAFRQNLIERGIAAKNICTVPNGADVSFWQPQLGARDALRRRLRLDDRVIVLYIGAHGISQRLATVLRAAEWLRDDRSFAFVFVGEGAEKAELMQRAADAKLDSVHFFDPVDKAGVRDFYAAADICLVPLRDIALFSSFIPSKMFEILAMKRPIVASLRGEAASILETSGGAIVVPPEDDAAIAAAIRRLRDTTAREETGRAGAAFVAMHYSRAALAARYAAFLDETRRRYHHGQA
jgi:hypothetical protein